MWTSLSMHWSDMILNMLKERTPTHKPLSPINRPQSRTSLTEDWILLCWNSMLCVALFHLQDVWTWKCKVISAQVLISNIQSVFLCNWWRSVTVMKSVELGKKKKESFFRTCGRSWAQCSHAWVEDIFNVKQVKHTPGQNSRVFISMAIPFYWAGIIKIISHLQIYLFYMQKSLTSIVTDVQVRMVYYWKDFSFMGDNLYKLFYTKKRIIKKLPQFSGDGD